MRQCVRSVVIHRFTCRLQAIFELIDNAIEATKCACAYLADSDSAPPLELRQCALGGAALCFVLSLNTKEETRIIRISVCDPIRPSKADRIG